MLPYLRCLPIVINALFSAQSSMPNYKLSIVKDLWIVIVIKVLKINERDILFMK